MKALLIVTSILLSLSTLAQQDFLPQTPSNSFLDYQKQFDAWRQNIDENQKGYKWHMRWLNFTETRTGAYGQSVSIKSYLDAAAQVTLQKGSSFGSRASDSTWAPEGPDTLTGAYNSASSHGVARVNTITFHPTDTNTYWVGVSQGGIWKTTNSGKTYTPMNDGLPILRISDIAVDKNHPDTLYASVCDYAYIGIALSTDDRKRNTHYGAGLYKSYDGGLSWNPTGLTYKQDQYDYSLIRRTFVSPKNAQELICAGVEGILKSLDGGDTWTKKHNGLIWDFEQNPLNPNTLFASSGYLYNLGIGEPKMMVSHDFGDTWKTIGTGQFNASQAMSRVEITISSLDTNYMYAVSCGKDQGLFGFYKSIDAGNTWTQQISAARGPNILEWSEGGGTGGQGAYDLTIYVDKKDKEKVFVGGVNIWGTDDGGLTWDGCSYWLRYYGFTPHADQHFLTHNPLDNKYYMCNDGGVFRTDSILIGSWRATDTSANYEFPTKWQDVSSGMQITSLYRVGLCDSVSGYIISGAQDNGTFYRDDKGKWMNITGGDGMDAVIHRADPKQGVSSSQYGRFYRFNNYGSNTFNLSTFMSGSGGWTTPIEQSPTTPGDYYVGGENVIIGSSATGSSQLGFIPGSSNEPISAFAISGLNKRHLIVAKRPYFSNNVTTKLYYTENEGGVWTDITLGLPDSLYCTAVAIDDRNPYIVWATFGGFSQGQKVFRSDDGGKTWVNISKNLPDVPVNTIVQDLQSKNNTLYVGCDVGVYYTNDSLANWQLYAKSFPNVIVSDLEIHMKDRRLYASTFGRGIWSVGAIDTIHVFPQDTTKKDTVIEEPVVFVSESFNTAQFTLFPNPNNGQFHVKSFANEHIDVQISIVNVMGRTVFKKDETIEKGAFELSYQLDLADGVYFLRVNGEGKSKVQRFLVTH
jgi:hypothetical protein